MRVAAEAAGYSEDSHGLRLRELQLDWSATSSASAMPPLGSGAFQLRAELDAVDHRLEGQADLGVAGDVLVRADERATTLDGLGVALDGQLAVEDRLVALDADRVRLEAKLG